MIVSYCWINVKAGQYIRGKHIRTRKWRGWFLFGFIPLYIHMLDVIYE